MIALLDCPRLSAAIAQDGMGVCLWSNVDALLQQYDQSQQMASQPKVD
jgi:hypothetical protein